VLQNLAASVLTQSIASTKRRELERINEVVMVLSIVPGRVTCATRAVYSDFRSFMFEMSVNTLETERRPLGSRA
jgi:hypothetical protein